MHPGFHLSIAVVAGCSTSTIAFQAEAPNLRDAGEAAVDIDAGAAGDVHAAEDGACNGRVGCWQVVPVDSFDAGRVEGGVGDQPCTNFVAVLRDFKVDQAHGGHPDFEHYTGSDARKGIVASELDEFSKPIYVASGSPVVTTSKEAFVQWYRDVAGVNVPFFLVLSFARVAGVSTFASEAFFPLDGMGWGNESYMHNFGFTTEVHTEFLYHGGETFSFTGDDDFWLFVNGKLAIDLGGPHPTMTASVALDSIADAFSMVKGNRYSLAVFQAERHSDTSSLEIETNIEFVICDAQVAPPAPNRR